MLQKNVQNPFFADHTVYRATCMRTGYLVKTKNALFLYCLPFALPLNKVGYISKKKTKIGAFVLYCLRFALPL